MYRTLFVGVVAQRKCWLIDNYFKEYKHLKTAEPHVASNVRYISCQRNLQLKIHLSSHPEMVTTQVVLDCEATCGPSVCGICFNTNLTNLTNCAGLTSNKETIRFVFL